MRVGQAKELFRALTQQYFGGANVVFANQSRTAKQKEPLVVLTPGNVHRPQAPNYTFVDGEVVGHYLSRFSITVDLFTNGSPVVDEVSGKVVAYEDNAVDDMPLIFAGIVTNCVTTHDGADRKTEIEVVDNLVEIRDTYVTISYVGTVNWKTIFDDVANQMGVAVTYSYNAEFADIANGFSFVGLARDIMTKGCACCGLVWSLQNGVMQVKKPGDVMSREVFVLSEDSGLLGIPARVTEANSETSDKTSIGWEVEFFLNGAIHIDDYVKLESKTVTGYFRVAKLTQAGDNISGDWTCTARLMEVQG